MMKIIPSIKLPIIKNGDSYNHILSDITKIKKIKDNTYGYCEETSEPIGLKRLIARPIATLSIEAQEKHEKNEKIFADL